MSYAFFLCQCLPTLNFICDLQPSLSGYCIFKCRCVVLQAAGVWYRLVPWRCCCKGETWQGENGVACNIWHLLLWVIWNSKLLMRFIGWQTEAELFKHLMVYGKTAAGRLLFLKCCKFVSRKMCFLSCHPSSLGRKPVLFFQLAHPCLLPQVPVQKSDWTLSKGCESWISVSICYVDCCLPLWGITRIYFKMGGSRMELSKPGQYCIWELFIGN